jgi:hypothetical protein
VTKKTHFDGLANFWRSGLLARLAGFKCYFLLMFIANRVLSETEIGRRSIRTVFGHGLIPIRDDFYFINSIVNDFDLFLINT